MTTYQEEPEIWPQHQNQNRQPAAMGGELYGSYGDGNEDYFRSQTEKQEKD